MKKLLLVIAAFMVGAIFGAGVLGLWSIVAGHVLLGTDLHGPVQDVWIRVCAWIGATLGVLITVWGIRHGNATPASNREALRQYAVDLQRNSSGGDSSLKELELTRTIGTEIERLLGEKPK